MQETGLEQKQSHLEVGLTVKANLLSGLLEFQISIKLFCLFVFLF